MKYGELEKNRLDLTYQRRAQRQHLIINIGTLGVLGFLANLILKPEWLLYGLGLGFAIIVACKRKYDSLEIEIKNISDSIKKLKK